MTKKRKFTLLCSVLLISAVVLGAYQDKAKRAKASLMLLRSSTKITGDFTNIKAIILGEAGANQLKVLRGDAPEIITLGQDRALISKATQPLYSVRSAVVSQGGNTILCDSDGVDVVDSTGMQLKRINISRASSAAPLSDENIVIASTNNYKPVHIYSKEGYWLRSIGEIKQLYADDQYENKFLNEGIVLTDRADQIYYVSRHAPEPFVQKFNQAGELIAEFPIEGEAVKLQATRVREFLKDSSRSDIGGYEVITAATLDPATGHLWIGVNGTNKIGIVYEYEATGRKLGEYMLQTYDQSSGYDIITGIKGLTVKTPLLYAVTWGGDAYQFDLSTASQIGILDQQQKNTGNKTATSQPSKATQLGRSSFLSSAPVSQLPCPTMQQLNCTSNCATSNTPRNCGAEINNRLAQGDILIGPNSCTQNPSTPTSPGGCSATGTYCNTTTGVRGTVTTSLTCPACTPTTPPSSNNPNLPCTWNTGTCTWNCPNPQSSPIVFDLAGDGFLLTDLASGVRFDLNSDGIKEQLSWTASGVNDAWLALDRNHNGLIDNGTELFGNFTPQPSSPEPNGFIALGEYDKQANGGNRDEEIDQNDSVYNLLLLWQDINHNGISEPSELRSLSSSGIASISLKYKEAKRHDDYGNLFRYWALLKPAHGYPAGRRTYDVFLLAGN